MESKKAAPKPLNTSKTQAKGAATSQNKGKLGSQSKGGSKAGEAGSSRPCPEHSFLTDVADVRQMEQGLLQLLDDFHSGKLQAFGQDCTFEKMDQVREKQEKLARFHFDLDSLNEKSFESPESREASNTKLEKLMDNLQDLCVSIQHLQNDPSNPV